MFTEKESAIICALIEEDIWESGMSQDPVVKKYNGSLEEIKFKLKGKK